MKYNFLYTLDENHVPVVCEDVETWSKWMDGHQEESKVARDTLPGDFLVSTIFIGVSLHGRALFETAVFQGAALDITRYTTWNEALGGHNAIVSALQAGIPLDQIHDMGT